MSGAVSTPPDPSAGPDALELEIFRYAVESVVDELDVNITRTAHSPLVYETKDYSVGLLTGDFRLLGQSKYNLPIFVADLGEPVRDAVGVIGEDRLAPGDIFVTNFPPPTGSHLNNVITASPVFDDHGRVTAYVTVRTHWPDVGGLEPGSVSWAARHILHEGVQYRGLKIVSGGRLVPEVLATILANSWMPDLVRGDIMANVAACTLGVTRWREQVAGRWTNEQIHTLVEAQFAASARLLRSAIAELPDGDYHAECEMDDSGLPGTPPLLLRVRVVVAGERVTVDLSGLPDQVQAPINAGIYGGARSAVRVALKSVLAPERPADHGLFEPIELVIPPGTVMSATHGAPMGWWNQLVPTLIDLVFRAIGEGAPERVPAGHFAALNILSVSGSDTDGRWWLAYTPSHGGFGAHSDGDGFGPLMSLMQGDNRRIADEIYEARYPVRILSRRLLRDAGGAGRPDPEPQRVDGVEGAGDEHEDVPPVEGQRRQAPTRAAPDQADRGVGRQRKLRHETGRDEGSSAASTSAWTEPRDETSTVAVLTSKPAPSITLAASSAKSW